MITMLEQFLSHNGIEPVALLVIMVATSTVAFIIALLFFIGSK